MKYSIIIPVYKAEHTIRKCIDSLLNQSFNDIEILLINDGSPDASGIICKEYASHFPFVKYFEKENGGVSSARNVGLRAAKGKYILFVDSDDYVSSNYFARIDVALSQYEPNMLLFGIQYMGNKKIVWNTGSFEVTGKIEISKKVNTVMKAYLFSSLMSKVFERRIIKKYNLTFDETLDIGEDQAFIFEYAMHIKKIVSIPDVLYYYIVGENTDSLSRKRRDYLSEQLLHVSKKMLSSLNNANCSKTAYKYYYDAIVWAHYRSAYSACKELLKFQLGTQERRRKIKAICHMYAIKELRPLNIRNWVIAFPIMFQWNIVIEFMIWQSYKKRLKLS